jgi:hypothetical protein
MFGLYEILFFIAACYFGYNCIFQLLLGIICYEASYRISPVGAAWLGFVGAYLIHVLGVIETALLVGVCIFTIWPTETVSYLRDKLDTITAKVAEIPRGRAVIDVITSTLGTVYNVTAWILAFSVVKPYTGIDAWVELARWIGKSLQSINTDIDVLTDNLIKTPLVNHGRGGERLVDIWIALRNEVQIRLVGFRVWAAIHIKDYNEVSPMIIGMLRGMNGGDDDAMMGAMMCGNVPMEATMAPVNRPRQFAPASADSYDDYFGAMSAAAATPVPASISAITASAHGTDEPESEPDMVEEPDSEPENAATEISTALPSDDGTATMTPDAVARKAAKQAAKRAAKKSAKRNAAAAVAPSSNIRSKAAVAPATPAAATAQGVTRPPTSEEAQYIRDMVHSMMAEQGVQWEKLGRLQKLHFCKGFQKMLDASPKTQGIDVARIMVGNAK